MKRRADFGHYVSVLSEVMETTENMGAKLNPFFETFRKAIDEGKDISPEDYDKTRAEFETGVELYEKNLKKLQGLEAPIAIIGVHKKLVGAYRRFYEGCAHMNSSIDYAGRWVDAEQFDVSEKEQGDAMDDIARCVRKIMR
ncbi:hypothetical protein [Ligilactobacillus sp.]|uniref:hypothetical protein n=1 Tax=Ligilactobacillus sp. TaxID=2767921 RepID=UPI002FE08DF0